MAQASATSDPRFFDDPITEDELDELDVEISVLSPLKRTNDPLSLRLGVDGIYIKAGLGDGMFSAAGRDGNRLEQGGISVILLCA